MMTVYNFNSKQASKGMNSRKFKDKAKLYNDHKNYSSSNKPYSYDISQNSHNMQKDQKSLKLHNRNSEQESKQNQAIFKNMQKCNQKMEYYKLMGSLEEQKRTMLEQENNLLKEQNEQIKDRLKQSQNEIRRLRKKLQKYGQELVKHQQINSGKEDNFIIQLPNNYSKQKSKSRVGKPSPKQYENNDQEYNCQKCSYLQQQLMEERALYQKDRTYLKEQIESLSESQSNSQKQIKTLTKDLSGIGVFHEKKLTEISEKFRLAQNQLKKQLTLCYNALEEKCDLIRQLQLKIDFFQHQSHRIIKLLNIIDANNSQSHHQLNKTLPSQIQKQQRPKFTYNAKDQPHKYPSFFNSHQNSLLEDHSNIIQNRKKARKCGSIKKIELD